MSSTTMTRKEFDALDQVARRKFIASGGAVTEPTPPPGPLVTDPNVLTRSEFDALPQHERTAAIRAGRVIVNGDRAPAAADPQIDQQP